MKKNLMHPITRKVYLSVEENDWIQIKMEQLHTKNFSAYARKMLIDGYVIKRDFKEIKALTQQLASLSRHINQIALRANETRNIYEQDIKDLQHDYQEVKKQITDFLIKIIRE